MSWGVQLDSKGLHGPGGNNCQLSFYPARIGLTTPPVQTCSALRGGGVVLAALEGGSRALSA